MIKRSLIKTVPLALAVLLAGQGFSQQYMRDNMAGGKPPGVMVVLDLSGSMAGAPLDSVKRVLSTSLIKIPRAAGAALVTFSDCGSSRLAIPMARENARQVISYAQGLSAGGATDLVGALTLAEAEINRNKDKFCTKLLLLSDGGDTCSYGSGQVEAVAKRIADSSDCAQIDVVTIGVPEWESELYDGITDVGRGEHRSTEGIEGIEDAINETLDSYLGTQVSVGDVDWSGDYEEGDSGPTRGRKKYDRDDGGQPDSPSGEALTLENKRERTRERN